MADARESPKNCDIAKAERFTRYVSRAALSEAPDKLGANAGISSFLRHVSRLSLVRPMACDAIPAAA